MEDSMLIPEQNGDSVSARMKDNFKEVCEVTSVKECNALLFEGWGLLTIVSGYFYQPALGHAEHGVVYVMSRTVK